MGRLFLCYLEGRVYSCKMCKSHLAKVDELVSKVSAARPCPAPRPPSFSPPPPAHVRRCGVEPQLLHIRCVTHS